MSKDQRSVDELREEYINYMMATGGKDKETADRLFAEAIKKREKESKKEK